MARPLRVEFEGGFYHVTARGNQRQPIYRDDADRPIFVGLLAKVVEQFELRLHAYVLMRNHYHLLIELTEPNLSRAMRQLNGTYTQAFNRRHRRVGHLLQGRYKAILIDRDAYLVELSRYIHQNPVRVGDVQKAAEHPWSSAAAYVGKRPVPPFLVVEEVLRQFGRRRREAARRYAEFLQEGSQGPWKKVTAQTLLGGANWLKRMQVRIERELELRESDTEVPAVRALRRRPTVKAVVASVARRLGVDPEAIMRKGARGTRREVAMYVAWRVCGLTQREIGGCFGVSGYAVSRAIALVTREAQAEPRSAHIVNSLITSLKT